MMVLIPSANTPAEKSRRFRRPVHRAGIHPPRPGGIFEGMKTFGDKHARRQWKRKFKQEMRGCGGISNRRCTRTRTSGRRTGTNTGRSIRTITLALVLPAVSCG